MMSSNTNPLRVSQTKRPRLGRVQKLGSAKGVGEEKKSSSMPAGETSDSFSSLSMPSSLISTTTSQQQQPRAVRLSMTGQMVESQADSLHDSIVMDASHHSLISGHSSTSSGFGYVHRRPSRIKHYGGSSSSSSLHISPLQQQQQSMRASLSSVLTLSPPLTEDDASGESPDAGDAPLLSPAGEMEPQAAEQAPDSDDEDDDDNFVRARVVTPRYEQYRASLTTSVPIMEPDSYLESEADEQDMSTSQSESAPVVLPLIYSTDTNQQGASRAASKKAGMFGGPSSFGESSSTPLVLESTAEGQSSASQVEPRNPSRVTSQILTPEDVDIVNSMLGLDDSSEDEAKAVAPSAAEIAATRESKDEYTPMDRSSAWTAAALTTQPDGNSQDSASPLSSPPMESTEGTSNGHNSSDDSIEYYATTSDGDQQTFHNLELALAEQERAENEPETTREDSETKDYSALWAQTVQEETGHAARSSRSLNNSLNSLEDQHSQSSDESSDKDRAPADALLAVAGVAALTGAAAGKAMHDDSDLSDRANGANGNAISADKATTNNRGDYDEEPSISQLGQEAQSSAQETNELARVTGSDDEHSLDFQMFGSEEDSFDGMGSDMNQGLRDMGKVSEMDEVLMAVQKDEGSEHGGLAASKKMSDIETQDCVDSDIESDARIERRSIVGKGAPPRRSSAEPMGKKAQSNKAVHRLLGLICCALVIAAVVIPAILLTRRNDGEESNESQQKSISLFTPPTSPPVFAPSIGTQPTDGPNIAPSLTSVPTENNAPSVAMPSVLPTQRPDNNIAPTAIPTEDGQPAIATTTQPSVSPPSALFVPTASPAPSVFLSPSEITNAPSATPPSSGGTQAPSSAPSTASANTLRALLISVNPELVDALNDPTSPQSMAFSWLSTSASVGGFNDAKLIQRFAMATFYFSTLGDNWFTNDLWLSDEDECTWYSQSDSFPCDDSNLLTTLDLSFNNVGGQIPGELALLSNTLQHFDLSRRDSPAFLTGQIPETFGDLVKLDFFSVQGNRMSGELPALISNWVLLDDLDLSNNLFTGHLPEGSGSLTDMRTLNLENNMFTGPIPTGIGRLTKARAIRLGGNTLTGHIPSEVGSLVLLSTLGLERNQLTSMPTELGGLLLIRNLRLGSNQLQGSLPSELGNLFNILRLDLSSNQLSQQIPTEFGELLLLRDLDLSNNELSGGIPSELGSLSSLTSLNLSSNRLSGRVPNSFADLVGLDVLRLEGNDLSGEVPFEACTLFNSTRAVIASDCPTEIECPCCAFCCDGFQSCTCQLAGTDRDDLCDFDLQL